MHSDFWNNTHILNIMPSTLSSKVGTPACLPLCYISFSSYTTQYVSDKLKTTIVNVLREEVAQFRGFFVVHLPL